MALSCVPPLVVADAAMLSVFSLAMESRILLYCVVVVAASDSITAVLPVAAVDRAPKWMFNCSMMEVVTLAMWLPCGTDVVGVEISWTRAAECAELKASLWPIASLDSRSSALWRGMK